jgi:hypothetical protein
MHSEQPQGGEFGLCLDPLGDQAAVVGVREMAQPAQERLASRILLDLAQ